MNRIRSTKSHIFIIVPLLLVFIISGCGKKPEDTANGLNTLQHLAYCNEDDSRLCVEGFGKEKDEHLVILLRTKDKRDADIFLEVKMGEEKITFECYSSDEFAFNTYCIGDILPNSGEMIGINAYSMDSNTLLGSGNFRIQYGQIKFIQTLPDPQGIPSSYPNYSTYPATETNTEISPIYSNTPTYPSSPNYPNYPNTKP